MSNKDTKNTSCKECGFAIWEDITQTGCRLDMIEKYEGNKVKVDECFDEEKEFYVIRNRKCMYYRDDMWKWKDLPFDKQKELMEKEIQLRFQAIVIAGVESDDTTGLFATIDSLCAQELKPVHIAVVRPPLCKIKPSVVVDYLQETGLRWKLENVLDVEHNEEKYEDLVVDFIKDTHMYSRFNAGTIVPPDFFSTLNHKVHNDMFNFSALTPNSEGSGWTIPRSIYVYFMGNKQLTLLAKLEGHECPMYPVTEIVPSFPQ